MAHPEINHVALGGGWGGVIDALTYHNRIITHAEPELWKNFLSSHLLVGRVHDHCGHAGRVHNDGDWYFNRSRQIAAVHYSLLGEHNSIEPRLMVYEQPGMGFINRRIHRQSADIKCMDDRDPDHQGPDHVGRYVFTSGNLKQIIGDLHRASIIDANQDVRIYKTIEEQTIESAKLLGVRESHVVRINS